MTIVQLIRSPKLNKGVHYIFVLQKDNQLKRQDMHNGEYHYEQYGYLEWATIENIKQFALIFT